MSRARPRGAVGRSCAQPLQQRAAALDATGLQQAADAAARLAAASRGRWSCGACRPLGGRPLASRQATSDGRLPRPSRLAQPCSQPAGANLAPAAAAAAA